MSTFTEIRIGRVPITEEGVDRYRISDSSELHFTELARCDELNVSVGRIWTEMKVPVPWVEIATANYILGTITFNNPSGSSLTVRGWVDSVEPLSDSVDVPTCRVKWHFDFWEMYKVVASYDYGQVKRRPYYDDDTTPIQSYPYKYRLLGNVYDLTYVSDIDSTYFPCHAWWVIFSRGKPDGGGDVSEIEYYGFPVVPEGGMPGVDTTVKFNLEYVPNGTWVKAPSLLDIKGGALDELFGFAPSTIYGVWVTPVGLLSGTYSASDGLTPRFSDVSRDMYVNTIGGVTYGCYKLESKNHYQVSKLIDRISPVTVPFRSTEGKEYAVIAPDGSVAGTVPIGMDVKKIRLGHFISATEASIVVQFVRDSTPSTTYPEVYDDGGRAEGLFVTIPLPMLPVNENAWSDYVYSGQREYDRRTRSVETNSSSAISTASGMGQGAMFGAFGPQGFILGMVGGMIGGLTQYGVETFYRNDELQKSEDRLKSHQSPGILFSGDGCFVTRTGPGLKLAEIVFDSYSSTQLSNTRSNYGVSVDEILSSCDTLIRTTSPTGFYQIPNLIISGALPKEAKDTIKNKFASGVRLI